MSILRVKRGEEEEERRGGGREERRRVVIVNIACPNVVLCQVNERSNLLCSLGQHYQTISKIKCLLHKLLNLQL